MCAGCALAAMAAASGSRSWLAAHRPTWMTDRHLRRATIAIFIVAGLFGTMRLSGANSAAPPANPPAPPAVKAR